MSVPPYVPPVTIDQPDPATATVVLTDIYSLDDSPEYSVQAYTVAQDRTTLLQDISKYLIKDDGAVSWDGSANIHTSVQMTIHSDANLQFGKSLVRLWQLIRSREYNALNSLPADSWQRFSIGMFVVTTPGNDDLDISQRVAVTGYDVSYLLQNGADKAFSFAANATYYGAVKSIFRAVGLISDTDTLGAASASPSEWWTKHLPRSMNYPMSESWTLLDIINDLLAASGCRSIYARPIGKWMIQLIGDPTKLPIQWRWASGDGVIPSGYNPQVIKRHQTGYNGDVYNVPNRWIFIQDGLTFKPIEGSGMYTVNNRTVPPSDQISVDRIVRSVQTLQASGQADLKTQGDKIVNDALSQAEGIKLSTVPWPVARHLDVFQVSHPNLPNSAVRRVQAQTWRLPLWGGSMDWTTNATARL